MIGRPLKRLARALVERVLSIIALPVRETDLARDAIVFAPHQDDETLACGGTIARKRRLGARVRVVFLTDGTASHRRFIASERLREIRAAEAVAACARLGVPEEDVIFLDLPDGRLGSPGPVAAATARVRDLIVRHAPREIYVPFDRDEHWDHMAAHRACLAAARTAGLPLVVFEYPVWFLDAWPWMGRLGPGLRTALRTFRGAVPRNLRLVRHFRCRVDVRAVLARKQAALEEHRSQLGPLVPARGWPTLAGVRDGDFLRCFFRPVEIFKRYRLVEACDAGRVREPAVEHLPAREARVDRDLDPRRRPEARGGGMRGPRLRADGPGAAGR